MKDFLKLINMAKNGSESAMVELLNSFMPLILKFTYLMYDDDDFKSEMILKFIQLIKLEFNLDRLNSINNYIVIKYIERSLYHHYILLSKINSGKIKNECGYEITENDFAYNDEMNYILEDTLKSVLTEREYDCINLMIINGCTAEQAASLLGITKQAVNQCKIRAIKKLRIFYMDFRHDCPPADK